MHRSPCLPAACPRLTSCGPRVGFRTRLPTPRYLLATFNHVAAAAQTTPSNKHSLICGIHFLPHRPCCCPRPVAISNGEVCPLHVPYFPLSTLPTLVWAAAVRHASRAGAQCSTSKCLKCSFDAPCLTRLRGLTSVDGTRTPSVLRSRHAQRMVPAAARGSLVPRRCISSLPTATLVPPINPFLANNKYSILAHK